MGMPIGSIQASLAKRECIEPSPGQSQKLNFQEALKVTSPDLCILFEEPLKFFNRDGVLYDEFKPLANSFFVYDDFKHYRGSTGNDKNGKDHKMHPGYRAWILVIRDILVDVRYRRRGIGQTMVRESLMEVVKLAEAANRPLLVAVQPHYCNDIPTRDLADPDGHRRIYRKSATAEVFWRSIDFERYEPDKFMGIYQWAWYF